MVAKEKVVMAVSVGVLLAAVAVLITRGIPQIDLDQTPETSSEGAVETQPKERPRPRARNPVTGEIFDGPKTVVFIVIDTVRADRTSLCGYGLPTTPNLEQVVRQGAVYTCDAVTPAPWTLPSHASFFTGLPVSEHGAQLVPDSDVRISRHLNVRPLGGSYETLAEHFKGLGYQTMMISANPVIRRSSGLYQGFDHTFVATGASGDDATVDDEHLWRRVLRGDNMLSGLTMAMSKIDKDKPLFLFVNIFDAHVPYPEVPEGVGWLPATKSMRFNPNDLSPDNPFTQFTNGTMPTAKVEPFLEQLSTLYDYGVFQADQNVGRVLKLLTGRGWLDLGFRLVIVSDHGELLGEHGALRHGRFVYEPVVKVPLLFYDTAIRRPGPLPSPMAGVHVYDLLKNGRLPPQLSRPQSVAERNPNFTQPGADAAALWGDREDKLVWTEGEVTAWDLASDPSELRPLDPTGHPLAAELDELVTAMSEVSELSADPVNMEEALKAVGYLE